MTKAGEALPMTDEQRRKAELLLHCTFLPASFEKRFCVDMGALARHEDAALTEKQAAFLERCYWRYRRQIGTYAEQNRITPPPFVEPPFVEPPKVPSKQKVFEATQKLAAWTETVTGKAALDDGQLGLFDDE